MENWIFTPEFLKEIGFEGGSSPPAKYREKDEYGRAESLRPKGKVILSWNNAGYGTDYFGNKRDKNVFLCIEEDGGTRKVYYGVVFSQEDVRFILKRVS